MGQPMLTLPERTDVLQYQVPCNSQLDSSSRVSSSRDLFRGSNYGA